MKNRLLISLRLMVMLGMVTLMAQCRKDENSTQVIDSTLIMDNEEVSFLIAVVDEEGQLLNETTLMIANDAQLYTPNENNIYIIDNIDVPDIGRKFSVEKDGYYPQIKMLSGRSQSKNVMEVIMIKESDDVEINTGATGGIDGNGTLKLPSTLVNSSGEVYTGSVKVQSHYYDPDHSKYIQQAPGNMLGLNDLDEYVLLGSLGMYFIKLSNPENGEELNIPNGSTARITFPVADSQLGYIPASIPLWSMDENLGIWIYEGEARLVDDEMIADVSHFSWWNCDLPYQFFPFCATFVTSNGEAVSGLHVNAYVNNQGFGNDITDEEGKICGKLPKNEMVDFTLIYNNNERGETQIGPFAEVPIDITIEIPSIPLVSGVAVDCNQMLITNGYGIATTDNGIVPIFINSDGAFLYSLAEVNHSLMLVNQSNNEFESIDITASASDINLENVKICNQVNAGSISGTVMLDQDEDGIGDIRLEGIEVKFRNKLTQQIDYIVITNSEGNYSISAVPNVEYEIFIEQSNDMKVIYQGDKTPEDGLANEEWSSITCDGIGIDAKLTNAVEVDLDNDFILVSNGMGAIRGRVMIDLDGDLIGDEPVENHQIRIISFTQATQKETVVFTDSDGYYELIHPNFVGELKANSPTLVDYDSSPDPDGDDSIEGANRIIPIILNVGEDDSDNNFILPNLGSITGNVSEDTDNDGIADSPIEGITISLVNLDDEQVKSTVSDFNGDYYFEDLFPRSYVLVEQNEALIDPDYVDVYDGDESPEDANDVVDALNDDRISVTLEAGEIDADNNFVEIQLGSISGNVGIDTNGDDVADVPHSDQEITLFDVDSGATATTLSDENGNYEFVDLTPGEYTVAYLTPSGFIAVFDGDETPEDNNDAIDALNDGRIEVTLSPGEDDANNNFVDRPN